MGKITKNELRLDDSQKFDINISGKADTAGLADNATRAGGFLVSSSSTANNIPVRDGSGNIPGTVPSSRTINGMALTGNISLTAANVSAVPTTRTINGIPLSENISLTAANVSAVPTTRTINGIPLSENISLTAANVSAVPTTRTINGIPLNENISLTAANLGITLEFNFDNLAKMADARKETLFLSNGNIFETIKKLPGGNVFATRETIFNPNGSISTIMICLPLNVDNETTTTFETNGDIVEISINRNA